VGVAKSRSSEITRLIVFLNFDFDSGTEENLREAKLNFCELRTSDWRIGGKRLQGEIAADVISLMGKQPHLGLDCLDGLLAKISGLNLHFRWSAESTQHQDSRRLLGPERKVLTLAGRKFIVCRQLSTFESFRELFYGTVLESLENGTFSRLRLCPECRKFFWTTDLKRRFCGNSCKDTFNNRVRAEEGYFAARRAEKKHEQRRKESRQIDTGKFRQFLLMAKREATKGGATAIFIKQKVPGDWKVAEGWLKQLGGGKKAEAIWKDLPSQTKKILRGYWE
jgi:hypothetical protein